ncbi:MAG: enoyl-CoA hydratase-related protein, partial [Proteobacteria bacterium]|nr:enoyl-CoA hydratase-related protein [Pseudomonadota bacterium]
MISSTTEKLSVDVRGHTALVTINNPPANTWDEESLAGLKTLVDACTADRSIYAIVVTGQGEKFFSAGADLKLFAAGDKGVAATMSVAFGTAFESLANFRGVT